MYVILKLGFEWYGGNCPSWDGNCPGELSGGKLSGGNVGSPALYFTVIDVLRVCSILYMYTFMHYCMHTYIHTYIRLLFLAVQGSGALLSSNLEGALYKSP